MVSRIIKANDPCDAKGVRAFTLLAQPIAAAPAEPHPFEAFELRIAELERELSEVCAERDEYRHLLTTKARELSNQISEAEARGRSQGRAEAESHEVDRLEHLREYANQALNRWQSQLSAWDVASLAIAKSALENIFGEIADREDILKRIISQEIARLSTNSRIKIIVSATDFPDVKSLDKIEPPLWDPEKIIIESSTSVISGDCYLDIDFVRYDIGINQQSRRLFELLESLIAQGVRR